mmetsp:Transcript_8652/g.24331  ORF Transcript_8652/g.24331 Transcript_8652/m.24331 type:complete len:104 (+) Transcript_8652:855-1166(+)
MVAEDVADRTTRSSRFPVECLDWWAREELGGVWHRARTCRPCRPGAAAHFTGAECERSAAVVAARPAARGSSRALVEDPAVGAERRSGLCLAVGLGHVCRVAS